jgi:hypothetical protein
MNSVENFRLYHPEHPEKEEDEKEHYRSAGYETALIGKNGCGF